ncbi:hypothetical protein JAO73_22365 [Hymenobacter sp. BT523]|uniref:hypothetical protein n=1 Tax=Hymenobacter sp. BT523 TaxID=2795725 RepID=UPI0018EB0576|nr:hypothetical protein [Hymenobacter sp. BT523]MBJ6111781.1 hypothetical protein [Hymenobacter sp. BT523]
MAKNTFDMGPNLELHLSWSSRMNRAMRKRYWAVMGKNPNASAQLREEYDDWDQSLKGCYEVIKHFLMVTGGLPVAGDYLHRGGAARLNYPSLRVEKREVYSSPKGPVLTLLYEVEPDTDEVAELEEYREGDLVDDEE